MNNEANMTDSELDEELKMLLADATNETAVVEEPIIDMDELDAAATVAEVKSAAYADQDAANDPDAGSASAEVEETTATATPARTSRAPRVSRAAGAKSSSVLGSVMTEDALLKAACLVEGDTESPETTDALKTTVDGLAKKVGDKAVNLLRYQNEPKKLQNYTRVGLEYLLSNGSASSKDLTELLQKRGYTIGTARSQANQLMSLLPALKVADKMGRGLTVNSQSLIAKNFTAAGATA